MRKTRIISLIVVLCVVATLALAACEDLEITPPGHICRHLCSTCDKCTDVACNDPECADKCQGHSDDNTDKIPNDGDNQQQTPPNDDDQQQTPPAEGDDEDDPTNPETPTDGITVTLLGLDVSGITSNFALSEAWTDYVRTLDGPVEGSRFYLPYGRLQMGSSLLFVSRDGFNLVGWQCSEHEGVVHAPGEDHPVTKDVTFTAVWELKQISTIFEGVYLAEEPYDVSWTGMVFVRLEIVGGTLVFYDEDGDPFQPIELDIDGNVAVGNNGSYVTFTLTLDGDTLTVSAKRSVGSAIVGVFTKQN